MSHGYTLTIGVDSILQDSCTRIENLAFNCKSVATTDLALTQKINHKAYPNGSGGTIIEFEMDRPGKEEVIIYSIMGQKIATLAREYHYKESIK